MTPALAFLGHELATPVDLILQQKTAPFDDMVSSVRMLLDRYNRRYRLMSEKQEAVIRRNTRQYSQRIQFEEGDTVCYLDHRPHHTKPQKINQKWIGPFTITKKCNPVLYRIESDHNPPRVYTVHVGRLKKVVRPVEGPQAELPGPPPPDYRDNEEGDKIYLYPPSGPQATGPYTGPTAGPSSGSPGGTPPRPSMGRPPDPPDPPDRPLQDEDQPPRNFYQKDWPNPPVPGPSSRETQPPTLYEESSNHSPLRARTTSGDEEGDVNGYEEIHSSNSEGEDARMSDIDPGDLSALVVPIMRGAKRPYRATPGSAGYNLYLPADITLRPHTVTTVPLGLQIQLPPHYYLQLKGRSSLEKKGISLRGGVIDSDFRGDIAALLSNTTAEAISLSAGQKACQGIILKYHEANFVPAHKLQPTTRCDCGFGHSN